MDRRDNPNEENENQGNESDDTFGLPEIEYQPISREEQPTPSTEVEPERTYAEEESQQSTYQYNTPAEEPRSEYKYVPEEEAPLWPKVLGILLVVVVALGAVLYFIWYKPKQEEEKRLLAKQKQEQEAQKKEQERLAEETRLREEEERRKADSVANISKTGVFETLSAPTGRYYVVIASAVDGDLIMDHAKKLGKEGVSTKIIPPFGKFKFYRLTIAEGDTYAEAQEIANSKKSEFGDAAWVLKY
jgi:cytoskeletal protein RodZ